ncbi:MAG: YhdH/YhfP family quinone oxidoreductase [Desulfosalsimonadaceae bacterium]
MEKPTFKAMVVTETPDNQFERQITQKSVNDLPAGDVLVNVRYSSLNYKDALSASGNKGITKNYPHTPGIDAAGIVAESNTGVFTPGDKVIVTSYDLGMNTSGGFGEFIRVPADWVVKLPDNLSLKESMIYGTAGLTAGLSVYKLTRTLSPDRGQILVTGASGGVGSLAVSILVQSGYEVAGVSGKGEDDEFLKNLGVKEIISRQDAADTSGRPMLRERWAGVIDTVGGDILATAIKSTRLNGNITCCGNAASPDLPLTVFPFILRGVTLYGIDSQHCPMDTRLKIWEKLSREWKLNNLEFLASEITLDDLNEKIVRMLEGKSKGRTVIKL